MLKTNIKRIINSLTRIQDILFLVPNIMLVIYITSIIFGTMFTYKLVKIFNNENVVNLYINNIESTTLIILTSIIYLLSYAVLKGIPLINTILTNSQLKIDKNKILLSSFILIVLSFIQKICVNEYYFILEHHLAQSKIIDWNYLIVEVKKNWSPIEMDAILKSHPKEYASLSAQQINELIYTYKDPQLMQAQMYQYARMNFNNELAEKAKLLSQQLSQQRELELYKQSWSYFFSKFLPYVPIALSLTQLTLSYILPFLSKQKKNVHGNGDENNSYVELLLDDNKSIRQELNNIKKECNINANTMNTLSKNDEHLISDVAELKKKVASIQMSNKLDIIAMPTNDIKRNAVLNNIESIYNPPTQNVKKTLKELAEEKYNIFSE